MPPLSSRVRRALAVLTLSFFALPLAAPAAESTVGAIFVTVVDAAGKPLAGAHITALAPAGRYTGSTDSSGRYALLNITPDTYVVSIDVTGYQSVTHDGVTVLAGQTQAIVFTMERALKTIASVRSTAKAFAIGSTADTFTVTGDEAKATNPLPGAAGIPQYTQGTVQGAIVNVPGVDQDAFANAILRGGKIQDAVFDYDSVPIPQGLVAEPGGAIDSAQLFATGVGSTTTTLAGFEAEGQNALGGVVDQIPAVGTYPGSQTLDVWDGIGALNQGYQFNYLGATPDLKWRYAFSAGGQMEYLSYGDGKTFYPAEGGYGLALQTRGDSTASANIHYQLTPKDDLSVTGLWGNAAYDYYMTPFTGLTYGSFNGKVTQYPCGGCDQSALVNTPGRVLGNYNVLKAQWVHTGSHTTARLQTYLSQFGSTSSGAWWDDDSFPDGSISLYGVQGGKLFGASYDVDDYAGTRNHIKYGTQYTTNNSFLYQTVPTADEYIHSNPTIFTTLLYLGDTYTIGSRLDVTGTLRT
ncbi:MAG TPA: carboxypeptidase-like regulatory domain-containing protein, partial [Candidatus Tumulicola sp.]